MDLFIFLSCKRKTNILQNLTKENLHLNLPPPPPPHTHTHTLSPRDLVISRNQSEIIFRHQPIKTEAPCQCWKLPACADPGIFVRGGGPGQSDKKSSDNVLRFFFLSFIFQGSREGPTFFHGVSSFFPEGGGGSNCLFHIETHIISDFPGGSGPHAPPPPSGCALAQNRTSCI